MKIKLVLVALSFLTCALVFAQAPAVGDVVPNISLTSNTGKNLSLDSLKGKVVLIDFWATWCKPCVEEIPNIKKLYAKYKAKGVEVYSISLDENANAWKSFIKNKKLTWKQVRDADNTVSTQWGIQYIPSIFIMGKNGKLVAVPETIKDAESIIKTLL
jgi:peroxiredoxin